MIFRLEHRGAVTSAKSSQLEFPPSQHNFPFPSESIFLPVTMSPHAVGRVLYDKNESYRIGFSTTKNQHIQIFHIPFSKFLRFFLADFRRRIIN